MRTSGDDALCLRVAGCASLPCNGHAAPIGPLSTTVGNGRYIAKGLVAAKCIGGTDADGDGYCAEDADAGFDSLSTICTPGGSPGVGCNLRHKAWMPSYPVNPALVVPALAGLLKIDNDADNFSTFQ